ncbi:MAG TPA: preprotein translocase subunit SecG [Pyrinomonadaceae bacterium]|nr:preprotein translocase subunit SecG [Pyrinomonadaceae bacterium]
MTEHWSAARVLKLRALRKLLTTSSWGGKNKLVYILYTLFFISCILLIASVLLQPGKTDAGALFTSNISSTAFQPRGSQTILSKITIGAATVFMLSALFLAMPALTGNISVLQTTAETPVENAPAADANANTVVNANAASNMAVVVNTNSVTNGSVNADSSSPDANTANANK